MDLNEQKTAETPVPILHALYDWFIEINRYTIVNSSMGDYSRSYNQFKRFRNIFEFIKTEVKKNGDNIKIADIGCNIGQLVFVINNLLDKKDKILFHGVDISPVFTAVAESTKKTLGVDNALFGVGDAENLKLQDNSFDILYASELIEHLRDPERFLMEAKRVLKPQGVAIISTPNESNAVKRIKDKLSFSKAGIDKDAVYEPQLGHGHISVKPLNEWMRIFRRCGFVIESVKRGSFIMGGYRYNRHPILFSMIMVLDAIADFMPFMRNFSENITFKVRRPAS